MKFARKLWRATRAGVRGYRRGRDAAANAPTRQARPVARMETKLNPNPKPSMQEVYRAALRFAIGLAIFLAVLYFAHGHKYSNAISMGAGVGILRTAKELWRTFRWRFLADWDSEKIQLVAFPTVVGIFILLGAIFH